ncbi:glutamate ABC transporter substrate-binding protein [Corynebacterium heidelbergense]|uniref:Glutamate-binding protein n=1 Tax=Corynebacterium heidelbergense TaxID=2055947 RepID=A0A364V791_9CORY|nr:glutamate ABC transporter substrate-binding protein [Corynebacterium heidelbergense]RAV32474.1 glutamate-binding protein [Corynebacterium heidelbergense]
MTYSTHHRSAQRPAAGLLRRVGAALLAACTVLGLAACSGGEPRDLLSSIRDGHVILGTKFDQPGLGVRTPDRDFAGVDTDVSRFVVNYLAHKHGWAEPKITWRETPTAQRETLIDNGEVDMIAATYSINAGRLRAVDFAGPYLLTHQGLLVRNGGKINGLEDMDNSTLLCSVTGSTPAQKVKKALPQVQLQEFDTYSACVEALANGKVDALTTDATILAGFAQQHPGQMRVVELKKPDGKYWTNENYGIGMAKGHPQAVAEVNEALNAMHDTGEYTRIFHRNLGENVDPGKKPAIGDLSFVKT